MAATTEDDPFASTRMSIGAHLDELRKRTFRSVLVLLVCFLVAWSFRDRITGVVMWPWREAVGKINADLVVRYESELAAQPDIDRARYFRSADPASPDYKVLREPVDERLASFGVGDSFFFALNVSLWSAFFLGAPFVLWQLWQFIAAGLYAHEKKFVHLYFPFSVGLFVAGVLFCYYFVVSVGMYFLSSTLPLEQVRPMVGVDRYFDFLSTMCLAMGAVFQIPVLMIFFSSIGIIEPSTYGKYRGHFLIVALLVAAILTPGPDMYSQMLMAGPMLILYEVGIVLAKWRGKSRRHPTRA
jgi:sec-independent protein translocase protein TatC